MNYGFVGKLVFDDLACLKPCLWYLKETQNQHRVNEKTSTIETLNAEKSYKNILILAVWFG